MWLPHNQKLSLLLSSSLLFATFILLFCLPCCDAAKITNLPDYVGPSLSMDSGYITIDESLGRNYFYWLIESENSPSTDPLVVWFQGGPGCSSLSGLFTENGPFQPAANGSIVYTDLGWTKFANLLWVESPMGVGFSYSDHKLDYVTNDNKTAEFNYQFLQQFLETFPEYQGRDLWFTGESYAGVYVPTLTNLVVSDPSSAIYKQFQGFMVGNPVFGCAAESSLTLTMNLFYYHGLISHNSISQWNKLGCDLSASARCIEVYNEALNSVGEIYQQLIVIPTQDGKDVIVKPSPDVQNFPSLDPDNLYQDFCTDNGTLNFSEDSPNDCNPSGDAVSDYLNRADVQTAIHAKPGTKWETCTSNVLYRENVGSLIPYYQNIFDSKPDIKVLVYSGDVDMFTVPFASTQACLSELNDESNPLEVQWQPWFVNGATAGYVEKYKKYTYATVKGAGHEAPGYQPWTSFNLFSRFLINQTLNASLDSNAQEMQTMRNAELRQQPLTQGAVLRSLRNQQRNDRDL